MACLVSSFDLHIQLQLPVMTVQSKQRDPEPEELEGTGGHPRQLAHPTAAQEGMFIRDVHP